MVHLAHPRVAILRSKHETFHVGRRAFEEAVERAYRLTQSTFYKAKGYRALGCPYQAATLSRTRGFAER